MAQERSVVGILWPFSLSCFWGHKAEVQESPKLSNHSACSQTPYLIPLPPPPPPARI